MTYQDSENQENVCMFIQLLNNAIILYVTINRYFL